MSVQVRIWVTHLLTTINLSINQYIYNCLFRKTTVMYKITIISAVKSWPVLHFCVVIFFWSFWIIGSSTFKCWELGTAHVVLGGVRDVALLHYPSCTDSMKQSLQFSCKFAVFNAPEDHFVSRYWYFNNPYLFKLMSFRNYVSCLRVNKEELK
jgi:hypothetical protein